MTKIAGLLFLPFELSRQELLGSFDFGVIRKWVSSLDSIYIYALAANSLMSAFAFFGGGGQHERFARGGWGGRGGSVVRVCVHTWMRVCVCVCVCACALFRWCLAWSSCCCLAWRVYTMPTSVASHRQEEVPEDQQDCQCCSAHARRKRRLKLTLKLYSFECKGLLARYPVLFSVRHVPLKAFLTEAYRSAPQMAAYWFCGPFSPSRSSHGDSCPSCVTQTLRWQSSASGAEDQGFESPCDEIFPGRVIPVI